MRSSTIKIPIYSGRLCMIHGKMEDVRKKYFPDWNSDGCLAVCWNGSTKKSFVLYVAFQCISAESVAHEATHIKNMIFKNRGLLLDVDNDEAEAYLVGWLAEAITKFLNKK